MPKIKNTTSKGQGLGLNNPIPTMAQQESINQATAYGLSNRVPTMAKRNEAKTRTFGQTTGTPMPTDSVKRQPRGRGVGLGAATNTFVEGMKKASLKAYKADFPLVNNCATMDAQVARAKQLLATIKASKPANLGQTIIKRRNILNLGRWINKMENYIKDIKCGVTVATKPPANFQFIGVDGAMQEMDFSESQGDAAPQEATSMMGGNTLWYVVGGAAVVGVLWYMMKKK